MRKELHWFFVVSVTVLKCDGDDRDGYDGFQKKRRAHSPAIIGEEIMHDMTRIKQFYNFITPYTINFFSQKQEIERLELTNL